MKRVIVAGLSAIIVSACASNQLVHFGGVLNPGEVPEAHVSCEGLTGRLEVVEQRGPRFPRDLALYLFMNQNTDQRRILLHFDVGPDGRTRNIRYAGPASDLERGATRDAVLPAARAIADWTYRWTDSEPDAAGPQYARECITRFDFMMRPQFPQGESAQ